MDDRFNCPRPAPCGCYLGTEVTLNACDPHSLLAKNAYDTRPSVRCLAIGICAGPSSFTSKTGASRRYRDEIFSGRREVFGLSSSCNGLARLKS